MNKLIFTLGRSAKSAEIELNPADILAVRQRRTEGSMIHSREVYTKNALLIVFDKERKQSIPKATQLLDELGGKPFTTVGHTDSYNKLSYLELARSYKVMLSTDDLDHGDIKRVKYKDQSLGRLRLGVPFTDCAEWKSIDAGTKIHCAILRIGNNPDISVAHLDGHRLSRYEFV